MMWPGSGWGGGWLLLAVVVLIALVAAAVAVAVAVAGPRAADGRADAAAVLAERLARGEITVEEYQQRRTVLGQQRPAGTPAWLWGLVAAAAVVLVLLAAALAAGMWRSMPGPGSGWMPMHRAAAAAPGCTRPDLPGPVVTVTLADMGPMMGRPGPAAWPAMMSATADRASVPAGRVSLRAVNAGHLVHELMVLPLPAGQPPGGRPLTDDVTVPEEDALAEARSECAGSAGHGLVPGGAGSTTLHLAAGRYELACNLPGHYAMGMRTVLDVR